MYCLALQVGDVVKGTVQSVKPYGAFLEIGQGVNGLLHISQISEDRVTNVDEVLSVGDELKVPSTCSPLVSITAHLTFSTIHRGGAFQRRRSPHTEGSLVCPGAVDTAQGQPRDRFAQGGPENAVRSAPRLAAEAAGLARGVGEAYPGFGTGDGAEPGQQEDCAVDPQARAHQGRHAERSSNGVLMLRMDPPPPPRPQSSPAQPLEA